MNRQPLGQHFLKDRAILKKIAAFLPSKQEETIVEIGAGHGELTGFLRSENPDSKIIAIEKDAGLAEFLRKKFADDANIKIAEGDALKILPQTAAELKRKREGWKLAGNIPYYITGRLLRIVGALKNRPSFSVLALQKEVAERIAAVPPKMNRLAASVQFWAEPKVPLRLPKTAFDPPPAVDSAIIMLAAKKYPPTLMQSVRGSGDSTPIETKKYYLAVRALFAQPRKTILNNIQSAIHKINPEKKERLRQKLKAAGIKSQDRPQNLNVENIIAIALIFNEF